MAEDPKMNPVPLPRNPVADADLTEALSGPAPYVNRIISTYSVAGMRLAFLEEGGNVSVRFRSAVLMSFADAASLRDLIISQLERAEAAGAYLPSKPTAPAKTGG